MTGTDGANSTILVAIDIFKNSNAEGFVDTRLFGFTFSAQGTLVEWKQYLYDPDQKYRILIYQYNAEDPVTSISEVERVGSLALWKGPPDLSKISVEAGTNAIFLAK